MRTYAVFGFPVRHSLSPWIHAYFARIFQRRIVYSAHAPQPGQFAAAARDFFAAGGRGLNITAPFKKDGLLFAARASAFARRAGAANVLSAAADGISAHNTDGAGLIKDITQNWGISVSGKKVLIAGAGGAARAAALALAGQDAKITVAARRLEAAAELAKTADGAALELAKLAEYGAEYGGKYDIILNTVPGGAPLPAEIFTGAELAYDLNYGAAAASFLRTAAAAKQRADGGGMLVEQAALSFAIWEGAMPSTKRLINYLRARGNF